MGRESGLPIWVKSFNTAADTLYIVISLEYPFIPSAQNLPVFSFESSVCTLFTM